MKRRHDIRQNNIQQNDTIFKFSAVAVPYVQFWVMLRVSLIKLIRSNAVLLSVALVYVVGFSVIRLSAILLNLHL